MYVDRLSLGVVSVRRGGLNSPPVKRAATHCSKLLHGSALDSFLRGRIRRRFAWRVATRRGFMPQRIACIGGTLCGSHVCVCIALGTVRGPFVYFQMYVGVRLGLKSFLGFVRECLGAAGEPFGFL